MNGKGQKCSVQLGTIRDTRGAPKPLIYRTGNGSAGRWRRRMCIFVKISKINTVAMVCRCLVSPLAPSAPGAIQVSITWEEA